MTTFRLALSTAGSAAFACSLLAGSLAAQQMSTETRDPNQKQDPTFAKSYKEWLPDPKLGSPLVDHRHARVKVETIGRSDEGRELVVVWVSSDATRLTSLPTTISGFIPR